MVKRNSLGKNFIRKRKAQKSRKTRKTARWKNCSPYEIF